MGGKNTSHLGKLDPAFHPKSVKLEVISRESVERHDRLSQMTNYSLHTDKILQYDATGPFTDLFP